MGTRAIVTSQPVVACDVCGRRLLRGENPDVFVDHGERRTVCELCAPRAAAEGWLRESDHNDLGVAPARVRRTGSLFGRLRQLREPAERPLRRETGAPRRTRRTVGGGESGLYHDEYDADDEIYGFLDGAQPADAEQGEREIYIGSVSADASAQGSPEGLAEEPGGAADMPTGDLEAQRALEIFNASDLTQRVAGVARSLGEPSVVVRALEGSGASAAIVVAWELCWYRYEVDLADETLAPRLVAEGMELSELPDEDRTANAAADERGRLALL